jgi:hypothetical protein
MLPRAGDADPQYNQKKSGIETLVRKHPRLHGILSLIVTT